MKHQAIYYVLHTIFLTVSNQDQYTVSKKRKQKDALMVTLGSAFTTKSLPAVNYARLLAREWSLNLDKECCCQKSPLATVVTHKFLTTPPLKKWSLILFIKIDWLC